MGRFVMAKRTKIVLIFLVCQCFLFISTDLSALEIVVDNDQGAPVYAETGSWSTSPSTGYAGGTYRYCLATSGAPTHTATWTPDIPSQQRLEVYAAYLQSTNRSTNIQVTISHSQGVSTVSLNQNGPQEVVETYIGEYLFDAGTSGYIRIDNGYTTDNIIADAFILRTPVDPLPIISNEMKFPEIVTPLEPILFTATITDNTAITSASLCYTLSPSMESFFLPVFDDGNHFDYEAGDNIYGVVISPLPDGAIVEYYFIASDDLNQLGKGTEKYFRVGDLPVGIEDTVVDNDDGLPGYVETGSWNLSTAVGYNGGTYVFTSGVEGEPTHSATWTPNIPRDGIYEVYAFFNGGPSRSNGIPMTITHSMGESVVYLDQTNAGYQQAYLGDFPFEAGTNGSVRMDNNGESGIYISDAMIWHQPSDPLPFISHVKRTPNYPSSSDTVVVTAQITDNSPGLTAELIYTVDNGEPIILPAIPDNSQDDQYTATIPSYPDGTTIKFHYSGTDNLDQTVESPSQQYTVGEEPKTVYVILGSDTSVWGITDQVGPADWDVFENREKMVSRIYEPEFRHRYVDSLGTPFKMTWYMHGGGWFTTANNSTPISATYHLRKNWGTDILKWDDTYELHYHHFTYDEETGWEMAPTFAETIPDYEWTVSEMILEEDLFITSFRSGWNYMDNPYQQYLERWVPFRMEGVQTNYLPYHPSFTNYREPGEMKGWEVRHDYMASITPARIERVFKSASIGNSDRVVCLWSHQNETDFPEQIAYTDELLHEMELKYPGTQFLYCSAKEAMQRWLGHTNPAPPPVTVVPIISGDTVNVEVITSDDIYQEQPWIAARRYDDRCVRLDSTKVSPGRWTFDYSKTEFDAVAVALSDIYGNEKIVPVDDGSKRWTVQSEFIKASPVQVDFDTSPTLVMLQKEDDVYHTNGSLVFEHQISLNSEWQSIEVVGTSTPGTAIKTRFKIAATHQLLASEPWSSFYTEQIIDIPDNTREPWIQIEITLEGTESETPQLDSVEVKYSIPTTSGVTNTWNYY
jgi:hypothetical protein